MCSEAFMLYVYPAYTKNSGFLLQLGTKGAALVLNGIQEDSPVRCLSLAVSVPCLQSCQNYDPRGCIVARPRLLLYHHRLAP